MRRRPIISGNWKMHGTLQEATRLAKAILQGLESQEGVEVVLCPPFTALSHVGAILKGSQISLGAQDLHWEEKGAYTGEISPVMLKDAGCRWSIIGHSERRHGLGETDGMIHRKLLSGLRHRLGVILCVGETLESRQAGKAWKVVEGQLQAALEGVEPLRIAGDVVIAYEPVWAIGTGHNATPAQAQEVHQAIRSWLIDTMGKQKGDSTRIQYGGSVNPENAPGILSQPDVDGALVGGASLDPKAFLSIVEAAHQAKGAKCSTG